MLSLTERSMTSQDASSSSSSPLAAAAAAAQAVCTQVMFQSINQSIMHF